LDIIVDAGGRPFPAATSSVLGNAIVIDIPDVTLTLPTKEFQSVNPAEGIALITVTSQATGIRMTITGSESPPTVDLTVAQGLVVSVMPQIASEPLQEEIQIVVTGEQEGSRYFATDATTATRTETPLRDIPQSIQVIPQTVLEDQQVLRLDEAVRNTAGVIAGNQRAGDTETFTIRGFNNSAILRDGFRQFTFGGIQETANLEQIEILRGSASILYGAAEPGGVINLVTKQPLSEPFYEIEGLVGSYGLIEPRIDLSGPLTADGNLLYRLNALYRRADSFRDFDQEFERYFIAPTVSWQISDQTNLTVELEYLDNTQPYDRGLAVLNGEVVDVPYSRIFHEPDDFIQTDEFRMGYQLEHRFSDHWSIRHAFRYANTDLFLRAVDLDSVDAETEQINRSFRNFNIYEEAYDAQANVVGNFSTGSLEHELLAGIDFRRRYEDLDLKQAFDPPLAPPAISIFNPEYGYSRPDAADVPVLFNGQTQIEQWGFYLQDLIAVTDNVKLLLGGRYDVVDQTSFSDDTADQQNQGAFSPRVGIVYQPIEPLSFYASFSQSFSPNFALAADGALLAPERGTQFEIGAKAELFDNRLIATLALYNLTKSNVAVSDPNNSSFSVALGEQRSRGVELNVIGEILAGWNAIASYSYIDAEITESFDDIPEGGRPPNVPQHSASLWTTYEIQSGDLQGLGFGLGLFFVGDRFSNEANTINLDRYLRTDAAIYYQRDNWNLALNFKNIFNVEYIRSGLGELQINPGEPFTVIGSVRVQF
ncbi:TonB-dependent siderophore receptor, partial [Gloeocapsopsis crepidinum]|uniref:TonB-dependent siderophore receptor n=1 Tax=Gloeocapsopsis crepidinum TaxID=693223 RepID=UPI003F6FB2D9